MFYYDRFVLLGKGNVQVDLGGGKTIAGDTFAMDLRLNRYIVAGNVHIAASSVSYDGAALSSDLESGQSYFVALPGTPERWSFAGDDFAHPTKGAEVAADAFMFPSVAGSLPAMVGKRVTVGPGNYLRFDSCRVEVVGGYKIYFPLPACYVGFGSDPNLYQNSLSGANVGAQYKFAGNANAASAVAINYDQQSKLYAALQQNFSSPKAWAVFSVSPLFKTQQVYSALAADQPSDRFGVLAETQYHTFAASAENGLNSYQFSTLQATQALPVSFGQVNYSFGNESARAAEPGVPPRSYVATQPSSVQFGIRSNDLRLGPVPAYVNVAGGYGTQHDAYGLQTFGGVTYPTIWFDYVDLAAYAPSLAFGDRSQPDSLFRLDFVAHKQRQWQTTPHYIDQTTTAMSATKSFAGRASVTLSYSIANVGDVYGTAQREAYPAMAPPQGPGYAAFEGLATFRTLALGATYTPNAAFDFALTLQKHTDFPAPVPGFLSVAQPPILGENPYPNYLGQPPYNLTTALRLRINPQLSIDLQDAYYFNYDGVTWNGFVFVIRP